MKELVLQPRLRLLADMVPEGARLADVGTDHGYLPVFLLQKGRIAGAIASDIVPGPLQHARQTATEYEVEGIDFRLCPGLDAIGAEEADTIVIAVWAAKRYRLCWRPRHGQETAGICCCFSP